MNESQWQLVVTGVATRYGWLWYHTHDSRRSVKGFPDLVLVKGDRVLYVELKKAGEYPTREQKKWLAALHAAGQEVAVWWPKDQPAVVRALGPRQERLVLPVRYRSAS